MCISNRSCVYIWFPMFSYNSPKSNLVVLECWGILWGVWKNLLDGVVGNLGMCVGRVWGYVWRRKRLWTKMRKLIQIYWRQCGLAVAFPYVHSAIIVTCLVVNLFRFFGHRSAPWNPFDTIIVQNCSCKSPGASCTYQDTQISRQTLVARDQGFENKWRLLASYACRQKFRKWVLEQLWTSVLHDFGISCTSGV